MRDNSRLFQAHEFQPRLAMTMGIATILESRRVILLATGEHKAEAVRAAVEGPLSALCQASALQLHERATFILGRSGRRRAGEPAILPVGRDRKQAADRTVRQFL